MQSALLRGVGVICVKLQNRVRTATAIANSSMKFPMLVFLNFFIIISGVVYCAREARVIIHFVKIKHLFCFGKFIVRKSGFCAMLGF